MHVCSDRPVDEVSVLMDLSLLQDRRSLAASGSWRSFHNIFHLTLVVSSGSSSAVGRLEAHCDLPFIFLTRVKQEVLKQLQGTIEEESGEASGSQLELIERLKGKQMTCMCISVY